MQDPDRHTHRVHATSSRDLADGHVRYAWKKSLWELKRLHDAGWRQAAA